MPQGIFEPYECPICGKNELRTYQLGASPTSGGHIIRAYCNGCKEYISLHDREFHHNIVWEAPKGYAFYNEKKFWDFDYSPK